MKMPASFAEFSDALQKARIKDGSFCKNELTCIHYNGLTHAMIGWNANLYDLNLFAQRLASLTEEQKKGMDALLKIKQNHRVAPIPLNQLINLTYNTDICCFAPRVSNHEELGAFLYANEMLSNEAMALLDTTEEGSGFQERLLELLGEQHQEDHGGVFTDFGYAELGGEIKDIYVCQSNETACFHRSDAPVVLEVRKGFFNDPSYDNDKTAVLNLPAADAGIWRAVEKVDAASVDECAFRCVDCLIPFLRDAINNAKEGCSVPYIHFTEDQKLRANSVDLVEFLRRQGEKLISSGQDKRLTSDHSITVHGNEWYDHAAERGGHAISFVQNFYGLTYPEAVTRLLNGEQGEVYIPAEKKEKEPPKEFALPPSNQAMRRVYAYLLQQRHISREVLSAFAQKGLIYESRELSIDQTKVYHNAVFVGFDERGVARHAHKRGLYTQGKSYRGNIEGSDPRCSFHWVGTSDRLYVFEAPIDLLAFLTLYPDGWQQHSYVALCGTAEHAMLWMLEKNPNLRKTILCLDHDAAGIEAVGRLSDVLREHGYSQIAPLQSEYKDWDEDLKARHGLEAQPAEEHPQFVAADLVCQRIGTRCKEVQPDRAAYQIPGLLLQYRNDLHWGRFDQAMEHMETMAALSLSVVLRECKQMGTALTVEQGVRFLESHILPHQNRSILKNRADEIAMQFQSVLAKNNRQGIRTQAEKKEVASAWLELAISCAKVPVKYEADEIKRRQKEEKTQRETEPVMA